MNVLGIDPGISGAVAVFSSVIGEFERLHVLEKLIDMPVMAGTGKRQMVNAAELARQLEPYRGCPAYLEQVSAMPGQGVSSMFSFGTSFGIAIGVLATLHISYVFVPPAVWKRRAGLIGKEKDAARSLAQRLYPAAELGLKKHIGRADAILIARYGDRT